MEEESPPQAPPLRNPRSRLPRAGSSRGVGTEGKEEAEKTEKKGKRATGSGSFNPIHLHDEQPAPHWPEPPQAQLQNGFGGGEGGGCSQHPSHSHDEQPAPHCPESVPHAQLQHCFASSFSSASSRNRAFFTYDDVASQQTAASKVRRHSFRSIGLSHKVGPIDGRCPRQSAPEEVDVQVSVQGAGAPKKAKPRHVVPQTHRQNKSLAFRRQRPPDRQFIYWGQDPHTVSPGGNNNLILGITIPKPPAQRAVQTPVPVPRSSTLLARM